jgi:ATP-dependent DNA helicase RecG
MDHTNDRHLFEIPVTDVKGVGPAIAGYLEKKGIVTVRDLLFFVPLRYLDNRSVRSIASLREGERAAVVGRVRTAGSLFFRSSRKRGYQVLIDDGSGTLACVFFRYTLPYMRAVGRRGQLLLVSGVPRVFRNSLQMVHPEVTLLDGEDDADARLGLLPLYSEIEGVKQGQLRRIIREALEGQGEVVTSFVPPVLQQKHGLGSLKEAMWNLHCPAEHPGEGRRSPHIERLILEEFFPFQCRLRIKRRESISRKGIAFGGGGRLETAFISGLSFPLTGAQKRVTGEIARDMEGSSPMNRLLHGDVGSGKTVCAVMAVCRAVDNGVQTAFMAPTEVLAEQHYLTIHRMLEQTGVRVVLLKGGSGSARKGILRQIESGEVPVVVGTHALIQNDVAFKRLGLVIIDEQHRFGVLQRMALQRKGFAPDVLVMSATPIPRTLNLVIHGDLDVSVIDEMPPGRTPVRTKFFAEKDLEKVHEQVREEVGRGRQVYLVYPLVDDSPSQELRNAKRAARVLKETVFKDLRVGLLHGRMKSDEKERAMVAFKDGATDVLVCTTVIEVGIDVPNAGMIVVEHAERFGLSQLHQLRGRVGRGEHKSKCLLVASAKMTDPAVRRLRAIEKTHDGFEIAEEDMRMRGPGEMLGVRQTGIPRFRVGDLLKDGDLMAHARRLADEALEAMSGRDRKALQEAIERCWGPDQDLFPGG